MFLLRGSENVTLLLLYFLIIVVALSSSLLYLSFLRQTWRWKQSHIPFLQPMFPIGHKYFSSVFKASVIKPIDQIYNENREKKLLGFFMGTLPVILLNDPKVINQVIVKNSKKTFATGFFIPESEVEAQYLVNTTTNKGIWKFARSVISSNTSVAMVRGHKFNIIKEEISKMLQQAEITKSSGRSLMVQNATGSVLSNYVNAVIGVGNDSDDNKQALDEMSDYTRPSYMKMLTFYALMISPVFQHFEPLRFLPRKNCKILASILQQEIEHRDESKSEKDDFVDILRSLREYSKPEGVCQEDPVIATDFKEINLRQMTGLSMTILLGSNDTTKGLTQFVIHLLSLDPDHQRKIREEVHAVLRKNCVEELTYEVIKDLHFTFQCILEAARLFPIFPVLMRRCSEDFQIPNTNYILRKGDRVIVSPYSFHRNEKFFPEPHKFDPERFSAKNRHSSQNEALLSFGFAPRKCPGANQGMFVAAAIIASLVCHFELKPKSHLKQMTASDFHPKSFLMTPKIPLVVDLVHVQRDTEQYVI